MTDAPKNPRLGSDISTPAKGMVPRNPDQLDPDRREIIFWDLDNPRSVVNVLTDKVREEAMKLPPHMLSKRDDELRKEMKPTPLDEQLRIAFWDEYFMTVDAGAKKMRMVAVYARVCSREYFYTVVENPARLAWILHPPEDYILQMRGLLNIGIKRFEEILKLPLENPNGSINTKLIAEIVKIVSIVDNRVKGAVTQKIQIDGTQKNLHLHANATPLEPPKTLHDIEDELKQIERQVKQLQDPSNLGPDFFEVDPNDERERDTIEATASRVET